MSTPSPEATLSDARIAEALAEGLWLDQFGPECLTYWAKAVSRAEEYGPESAAGEQVERFRARARVILNGPLAPALAALRRDGTDGAGDGVSGAPLTGTASREPDPAVPALTGFDPSREGGRP